MSDRYGLSLDDPLFRCEPLQQKHEALKVELAAMPGHLSELTVGVRSGHPLPPQTHFRRKRTYQAANTQEQTLLEERQAKRARTANQAKKRRFF